MVYIGKLSKLSLDVIKVPKVSKCISGISTVGGLEPPCPTARFVTAYIEKQGRASRPGSASDPTNSGTLRIH